eukprot:223826_1
MAKRLIERWELYDTVKKTAYSWIKKAIDKETKKMVLLEFIEKNDDIDSNNLPQTHIINIFKTSFNDLLVHGYIRQFEQKINSEPQEYIIPKQLTHIILIYFIQTDTFHVIQPSRHPNIYKLYGYHLNASYPITSEQKQETQYLNTMFFVYEYINAELFDLMHYISSLNENTTRTFFKQILNGLEALHNKGIIYGTLQPKHILINNNLQIKLAGYNHALIQDINSQKTCYKAPELYLNKQPSNQSDIFSLGVILFILLCGYPPFEQAYKTDKWFKPLIKGKKFNIEKFWKAHQKSPVAQMSDAKDLLTKMFCVDHDERINISDIKCHSWLKGHILSCEELLIAIRHRHMVAETKRRQDARKLNDLAQDVNPCKCIRRDDYNNFRLYPNDSIEGLMGEVYTYLGYSSTARHGLLGLIDEMITDKLGSVQFDFDRQILLCKMGLTSAKKKQQINEIRFSIQIFESRLWKDKYKELSVREIEEIKDNKEDVIYVVKMKRIEGDELAWLRLKNGFLLSYCSSIIKGLPDWARKMKKNQIRNFEKKDQEVYNVNAYDSYYNTLLKYEMANCF